MQMCCLLGIGPLAVVVVYHSFHPGYPLEFSLPFSPFLKSKVMPSLSA